MKNCKKVFFADGGLCARRWFAGLFGRHLEGKFFYTVITPSCTLAGKNMVSQYRNIIFVNLLKRGMLKTLPATAATE
jgi:hypothetical protein